MIIRGQLWRGLRHLDGGSGILHEIPHKCISTVGTRYYTKITGCGKAFLWRVRS